MAGELWTRLRDNSAQAVLISLKSMLATRQQDVRDFENLTQRFIGGRKVDKVPTGSTDVVASVDRVGDFNYDASYIYILVDNAGTAAWRRVAISSW